MSGGKDLLTPRAGIKTGSQRLATLPAGGTAAPAAALSLV